MQPVSPPSLSLDKLLRGVADRNIRREYHTGPAVGNEVL
jgi:hypothetical protein